MNNNQVNTNKIGKIISFFVFLIWGLPILIFLFSVFLTVFKETKVNFFPDKTLHILSSYDNQFFESELDEYAKKEKIKYDIEYMGDLSIVEELNANPEKYDAVWISNSIWLYSLNNSHLTSDSKSVSISPVVMGVKKKKARELGLIDKDITNTEILNLIKNKQIKYVMSSVTQTNTGATAYLGFLNAIAGSPEVLTSEMLDDETLANDMINLFSGVERVSGDESYLEKMFINGSDFEAIIASESSLININKSLKGDDQLYLLYPVDGVPINDSTFAFIKNSDKKEENFLKLQKFLLSSEGQKKLQEKGLRTWYGGVNSKVDKNVFNPSYGIDTTKYLITSKYPSKDVMTKAINLYIEELRKPTHVVFCLDYSGSMMGIGINQLRHAMNYILDYNQASIDKLQFSKKDKITVITFAGKVDNVWTTENGRETRMLINNINNTDPLGATALYDAVEQALKELSQTPDTYTKTIIAMTDGEANVGSISQVRSMYRDNLAKVPIYSIMFGDSNRRQLDELAYLSNAKVFDGKTNLLEAFKEVRGYN